MTTIIKMVKLIKNKLFILFKKYSELRKKNSKTLLRFILNKNGIF